MARPYSTDSRVRLTVRREAIARVGGFEERFRGLFEDQVFFYKLGLHFPVYVESACWSWYRQHAASECQTKRLSGEWDPHRPSPARATFLDWLGGYLKEKRITDPLIWKGLNKELWKFRHPRLYGLAALGQRLNRPWRVLADRLIKI